MCSLSRRQHECTACDGAVAMAMLFSEQQPKQVHKAHLQQSMCQAMELVELPQPGAFPDPQKPRQDFYKQPGLCPSCAAPHPQEMGHTPGKALLLTLPRPGSTRAASPSPAHRRGRHRGPPTAPPQQSSCPHCASPTVSPARGGSPSQGCCWGQESPAEVPQGCSEMEGEGTLPCSPQRNSQMGSLGSLEDASDLQGLLSSKSSPTSWKGDPQGWAQSWPGEALDDPRAQEPQEHLPHPSPEHGQQQRQEVCVSSPGASTVSHQGLGVLGRSRSSSGGT